MPHARTSLMSVVMGPIVLIGSTAALALPDDGGSDPPPRANPPGVGQDVRDLLDSRGEGIEASIWIGDSRGMALVAIEPDKPRPSASAIKTAYLVAAFSRFADDLDAVPAGLDEALSDDHPAMEPYSPTQRVEIREALGEASVRTLGGVMMGSIPAPNHVYNAAASVITALLGGPESLTEAIHAIDPAFTGIVSRRYMLAPRDVSGDNEATAASLAAVLGRIASGTVPGLDPETVEAIRGAMIATDDLFGIPGRHRVKGGSLNSRPITRVKSGWWEAPGLEPIVYVVMLSRDDPEGASRPETLEALATALAERLLQDAHQGRHTP